MTSTRGIRAGRAFVELFADDSKLVRGLRRASRKLKAFGAAVRNIGLRIAAVGAAVGGAMFMAAKHFASAGDEIAKMSKRTGVSVEALSELSFVATQSGTNFSNLEVAFRKMQRSIYDAGRGLSTQIDALKDMGLTYKDLAGLKPEEQFMILGDHLSRIKDETRAAGIAMSFFGRSGTNLLPMFRDGAAGIERLRREARRLGLTVTQEDAKAAEDLTDAFDMLWRTVKMGVFHIGSGLAPALTELSEKLASSVAALGRWLKANREWVQIAAAATLGLIGLGVAMVVVGTLFHGVGAALGVLASGLVLIGKALVIVKALMFALLTPVGLLAGAVLTLTGYVLYATGALHKTIRWLADRFGDLADDVGRTFEGIRDAMAAGDWKLAAQVLWAGLKLEWTKGIHALSRLWRDFKFAAVTLAYDLWDGIRMAHEHGVDAVTRSWLWLTYALRSVWSDFLAWHRSVTEDFAGWLTKRWVDAQEAVGAISEEDAQLQRRIIDSSVRMTKDGIRRERDAKANALREEHELAQKLAAQEHGNRLKQIEQENAARRDAIEGEYIERERKAQEQVQQAEQALRDALRKARTAREQAGPEDPEGVIDRIKQQVGDFVARMGAGRATIGAAGTFNAAALLGLQAGGVEDRIAEATEKTALGVERLRKDVKNNQATFT